MHNWYSARELAGLPGMPGTERAIQLRAKREHWEGQGRLGSKAIEYRFAALPPDTQAALIAASVREAEPQSVVVSKPISIKRDSISASRLYEDQRSVMTARLAFVREIERMSQTISQQRAIDSLVALAKAAQLSPYLTGLVLRANDRKTNDRSLSERTLKRWLADYRKDGESGLAPARRQKDLSLPVWSAAFLTCYQRPTKPSVEAAYAEFALKHPAERPSIHVVRRFLNKLSAEARERGRRTPQELKALQPFKRRSTKSMYPCDVFTADGHKFDAEVLNPRTGKPYRPEATTVLDVATRKAIGISIGEAESTIGVMDALRDAMQHGMFAMFYVDNGSGFANDTVREVVDRLGGTMTHALPYNSQARGLIERSHQTIWVNAAKKLTSYIGADMDKHAGTKVHRIGRKELRETGRTRLIPTFAEFMAGVEYEIETYNNSPHRGLAKFREGLDDAPQGPELTIDVSPVRQFSDVAVKKDGTYVVTVEGNRSHVTSDYEAELFFEIKAYLLGGGSYKAYDEDVVVETDPVVLARLWTDSMLNTTEALVSQYRDDLDLGEPTVMTKAQYTELLMWRKALRAWPEVKGYPADKTRPQAPEWVSLPA